MGGAIYLIRGDDDLVEMTEHPYDAEEVLQSLLAQYPRVLGGTELDGEDPKRWLLISREAPVPSELGGADRWSMDHFFVDQDAIPTVVEVKRSSDTRIRREVVGQMLDYAAHAKLFLSIATIKQLFETTATERHENPGELVQRFISDEGDPDKFWQDVDSNLRAGRMRMIFVADDIPSELRNVVEFLNSQMDRTEVLAIEVKQYVSSDDPQLKTLVPRVIGLTAEAQSKKGRGEPWTSERFFQELGKIAKPSEVSIASNLMSFGREISERPVEWGTGRSRGSFTARLLVGSQRFSLFSVYTTGQFSLNMGWKYRGADERGAELAERYRVLARERLGLDFDRTTWAHGWPMAPLAHLIPSGDAFRKLVSDFVVQARASDSQSKAP